MSDFENKGYIKNIIMKRKILITVALIASVAGISQNFPVFIYGHVFNLNGNTGVPNHSVIIKGDSLFPYSNTIFTDNTGHYSDTLFVLNHPYADLNIATYDCNNLLHDTIIHFSPSDTTGSKNFHICTNSSTYCHAGFNTTTNHCNTCVSFTDTSSSSGTVNSWYWNFGDGTSAFVQNPGHCFGSAGYYNVCLTINDNSGSCSDTFCTTVFIDSSYFLNSDFTWSPDTSAGYYAAYFFNNSSGNVSSWQWNFGDGSNDITQNPYHIFPDSSHVYNVCLIAGNAHCYDTICKTVSFSTINRYDLGGQVFAGNYPVDRGKAYLYSADKNYAVEDSMSFSANGYFYFYLVPEGNYIIKTEITANSSMYGQYAPTYAGDVLKWNIAAKINLITSVYDADIHLINIPPSSGPGIINGILLNNGNAAPSVEILLTDLSGNVINYTCTFADGTFSFSNLPYGTFILYAEEAGKSAVPDTVTLSANNPVINDVSLLISDMTGIDGVNSKEIAGIKVFPNPVTSVLNCELGVYTGGGYFYNETAAPKQAAARVTDIKNMFRIYNIFGTQETENSFYGNKFSADVGKLAKGIYLLKVESEKGIAVKKFVKE